MKVILIDHFREGLAFMYPQDKKKSQMFYLSRVLFVQKIQLRCVLRNLGLNARSSTLVLIKVLVMPVTCNMEWRSWNLLIACNTETVS